MLVVTSSSSISSHQNTDGLSVLLTVGQFDIVGEIVAVGANVLVGIFDVVGRDDGENVVVVVVDNTVLVCAVGGNDDGDIDGDSLGLGVGRDVGIGVDSIACSGTSSSSCRCTDAEGSGVLVGLLEGSDVFVGAGDTVGDEVGNNVGGFVELHTDFPPQLL
tara:strand:- start:51 stop:533 length:483 start_codon:yes stop_codon:yes gene_type:complete